MTLTCLYRLSPSRCFVSKLVAGSALAARSPHCGSASTSALQAATGLDTFVPPDQRPRDGPPTPRQASFKRHAGCRTALSPAGRGVHIERRTPPQANTPLRVPGAARSRRKLYRYCTEPFRRNFGRAHGCTWVSFRVPGFTAQSPGMSLGTKNFFWTDDSDGCVSWDVLRVVLRFVHTDTAGECVVSRAGDAPPVHRLLLASVDACTSHGRPFCK